VYSWLCFAFDPAGNGEGTYAQCISNALPFGRTLSELSQQFTLGGWWVVRIHVRELLAEIQQVLFLS